MLSLEQCKKVDPRLGYLSDEELVQARDALYRIAQLAFDEWTENTMVPKSQEGLPMDGSTT